MKLKDIIVELEKHKGKSLKVENDLILLDGYFDSYRGYYAYMALSYNSWEYGGYDYNDSTVHKVEELLDILKKSRGSYMTGWKGGEYQVCEDLEVFVSNEGCNTQMYIAEIEDMDYYVNIKLKKFED